MNPHDASFLVKQLGEFFEIAPIDGELIQNTLETFGYLPVTAASQVIRRFVQEKNRDEFERAQVLTLLREENARRARRVSPTPEWAAKKHSERRAIDRALGSIPKDELQAVIEQLRVKYPAVFRHLQVDPVLSDIGRSLIYEEVKNLKVAQTL